MLHFWWQRLQFLVRDSFCIKIEMPHIFACVWNDMATIKSTWYQVLLVVTSVVCALVVVVGEGGVYWHTNCRCHYWQLMMWIVMRAIQKTLCIEKHCDKIIIHLMMFLCSKYTCTCPGNSKKKFADWQVQFGVFGIWCISPCKAWASTSTIKKLSHSHNCYLHH